MICPGCGQEYEPIVRVHADVRLVTVVADAVKVKPNPVHTGLDQIGCRC